MPLVKVWIHLVWSTKGREPLLNAETRPQLFRHIRENAREKGIFVDFIGGYVDHVHCLVSLGTDQTISKIMQLLKGESSHWVNKNGLCRGRFEWQDEYFAVSVSESVLDKVRDYIANQEEHHRTRSFAEEYEDFMKGGLSEVFGLSQKSNLFYLAKARASILST